ncbi:Ig-like domain-containing protein, partial [Stenotrophomonas sp.]
MYDKLVQSADVRSAERSSHSPRPRRLAWLLALAAGAAALPGLAQAASCAGVAQWDQAKIYRAGDTLQKGGVLYRANQDIWNAPPDHPAGAPYYTNLGACDGSGANQPPVVSLTSPANGATFSAGSTVTVSATASDPDGSVSKVEFFR